MKIEISDFKLKLYFAIFLLHPKYRKIKSVTLYNQV